MHDSSSTAKRSSPVQAPSIELPAAQRTPVIEVDGLRRSFADVRAVDGLSFSVQAGEVFGLLGHNGAGKTTTIRVLNGLLVADGGSVIVLGLDPRNSGPEIRARSGVLTEAPSLDERLTARENLAFAARLFGVEPSGIAGRVDELLERFRLSDRADDRTAGFSRGMKQRLALARTLLHEPEILFLDEPTAALDPVAARDVHELVRDLASTASRTVILTTHNLVEAQRLCDRVLILGQGKAIAEGTPADIAGRIAGTGHVTIEVGAGSAVGAAEVVRAALDRGEVRIDRNVVLIDGIGREDVPLAVTALAGAGVLVYAVTPAEASLEEAYFALHADGSGR